MLPLARSGDTNAYHATMAEVATYANASVSSGAYGNVGRNKLHNALFNVQQRGTGPWTTGSGSGTYTLDRWVLQLANDTVSVVAATLADADRTAIGDEAAASALQNTFTGSATSGSFELVRQPIENVRRTAGKTVIVSFWAKTASGTPRLGVSIDQLFGSGGSPSAQVNGSGQAVTLGTTWARYALTFAVASIVGKTLGTNNDHQSQVSFWFSADNATFGTRAGGIGVQSGTVQIWGVQLEIGSTATPLEKLDPRLDLGNCQRFYQTGQFALSSYNNTGAGISYTLGLPMTMRAAPTTTFNATTNINFGSEYVTGQLSSLAVGGIVTATGAMAFSGTWTASADL